MTVELPGVPSIWVGLNDLSRTGVPVTLLRLLRALGPAAASVHVIARRSGELRPEVAALAASTTVLEPGEAWQGIRGLVGGLDAAGLGRAATVVRERSWRGRVAELPRADVFVCHGAGGWSLAALAPEVPRILWLHELGVGLDRCIPVGRQRDALVGCTRVLAVCGAVADVAVGRGAVSGVVDLLPGAVDPTPVSGPFEPEALEVMGAGTPGWRKGTDRLAAVAFELTRRGRPERVGWIGGAPSGPAVPAVGTEDPVQWHGPRADPWRLLGGASVVVVPSREDPLPLVALEAGVQGRPVVAMPTGGLPELLAGGRGAVPDRQDLADFVSAVERYLAAPELAAAAGEELRRWVLLHHDPVRIAAAWLEHARAAAGR